MPYEIRWVDPELFLKHKGVRIYCVYKDDDVNNGARTYHFTLNVNCGECCAGHSGKKCPFAFDVRELVTYHPPSHPPYVELKDHEPAAGAILANKKRLWEKYHKLEEMARRQAMIDAIDRKLIDNKKGVRKRALKEGAV